jgi:site-specific DNA-methyltransferase (adenine-specific)
MPIYQKFVQAAKSLAPRNIVMVTPSRWFAGGRGLDEFRAEMLEDARIKTLVDFPDASEAFPGTQIKGGVSYFVWDSSWQGLCDFSTAENGVIGQPMSRSLRDFDVLVRRNEAIPILEKVLTKSVLDGIGNLSTKVSAIQPFSIRTNFKGKASPNGMAEPIRLYGNGGVTYIERGDVPRNDDWIDEWKVLLGAAYGAGDSFPHQIYNFPIIAEPGSACSETYLVIQRFNSLAEAENFEGYLKTRFVRFLVSLRKYTQHLYSDRFAFVPDLDMSRSWTDADLFKAFGVSEDEQEFIASIVRPMDKNIE